MDPTRRYRVKAPDDASFDRARQLLDERARVLLSNPKRRTISATEIDDATEDQLRSMAAEVTEEHKYDLE